MPNDIAEAFLRRAKPLLMTHVVAGYPDLDESRKIVETMVDNGADLIEIQIPFTDPLADGPAITAANRAALARGVRPKDVFVMVRRLIHDTAAPLLVMTYANIPHRMGFERFASACAEAGAAGVIIPDLAFDEAGGDWPGLFRRYGTAWIPVLSPGMREERMRRILAGASGFAYVTLRTGTTGARLRIGKAGLDFLGRVREASNLPVAAGFGISRPEHVRALRNKADVVVIGSRLLELYDAGGAKEVGAFLRLCRREADASEET